MRVDREFACRIVPRFSDPIDISVKLRSYKDSHFSLLLIEPEPESFIGKVGFSYLPESMLLPDGPLGNDAATKNDPLDKTLSDLRAVQECENILRAAPMSFSYKDGAFTFGTSVTCSERDIQLIEQLFQHHALAFLMTLGQLTQYGVD